MPAIRVMIVDDHPVVREGLRAMLDTQPDIQVTGEAASAQEAVVRVGTDPVDVVLMDLRMPGGDGVTAISRIRAIRPAARVVVLTTYETHADILRAIEAGAAGYLLKGIARDELAGAIRSAHQGEAVLAPAAATKLVSRVRTPGGTGLSPRETEVLSLVGQGLTNAEIGARLFISEATVKTHVFRIFGKLEVSDRTAAVTRALARGLLPSPVDPGPATAP